MRRKFIEDMFVDHPPKLYVRLLCEELFREIEKEFKGLDHINVDIYYDEECYGISMDGEVRVE